MIYRDDIQYKYKKYYPISELSNKYLIQDDRKKILKKIENSPCYKYATKPSKKDSINKLETIISLTDEIIKIFRKIYPQLKIKHISIGGSYLFKENAINDIDFNIIVGGSCFGYRDYFDVEILNKKLITPVRKISFMIFGEQDFLMDTKVHDQIETIDYLHTDLLMREGVVFTLRNIFIYGFDIKKQKIDKDNLLVRLRRQLYQAELILDCLVGNYPDEQTRNKKATGRIFEALFYIAVVFTELGIKPSNVILDEKNFDTKDFNDIKDLINTANMALDKLVV